MDIELPNDFKEFLRLLHAHEVEYLLIGGYAVGYYGYPRATNDIDFWISSQPDNAARMISVLREFGFDTPNLSLSLFMQEDCHVRLGVTPIQIEILTDISGVTFDECYTARNVVEIDSAQVSLISLHHLKANKTASGRLKDLSDVENLP